MSTAKVFWNKLTITRLNKEGEQKFRWNEELSFSSSQLSSEFLSNKEKAEIEVSFIIRLSDLSAGYFYSLIKAF